MFLSFSILCIKMYHSLKAELTDLSKLNIMPSSHDISQFTTMVEFILFVEFMASHPKIL